MIDLTGKRFGRLIVIERSDKPGSGHQPKWKCKCDCGNEKTIFGASLRNNDSRSCGCRNGENLKTHGLSNRPEYKIWKSMIARCENPKCSRFSDYGGRGIKVCKRWRENFQNFIDDVGFRPSEKHSIERVDVNGNYEPLNCKWATDIEQARNKRIYSKNTSGHSGVTLEKETGRWRASIRINNKLVYLGVFISLQEAISKRKEAEAKLIKEME